MKLRIGKGTGGGEGGYKKFREYGFQCADFQMADTEAFWYTCTSAEFEKKLRQEKTWADENGIEIHQMHGPWGISDRELILGGYTPEQIRKMLEERKKSISACPYLGCKNWVIHPVFPYGYNDTETGKEEESFKINYEFYSELLETAKEYDVTICFENMPFRSFSISSAEKIKEFIDAIGDEHFKGCLDTGHVIALDKISLGDAVRIFGKDLKTLHVHDSKPGFDYHMFPFFGTADWNSFYEGLKEIGYNGVFNLEASPSWKLAPDIYDDMAKALVRISKQIMHYDED